MSTQPLRADEQADRPGGTQEGTGTLLIRLPLSLSVFLLAAGCGKPTPPDPVEARGHVQYANRKPGTGLVLIFHPQDEANCRHTPTVETDAEDGTFSLSCLPGRYKVTVAEPPQGPPPEGGPSVAPPSKTPVRAGKVPAWVTSAGYKNPRETPWDIEVPASGTNDLVLVLKP